MSFLRRWIASGEFSLRCICHDGEFFHGELLTVNFPTVNYWWWIFLKPSYRNRSNNIIETTYTNTHTHALPHTQNSPSLHTFKYIICKSKCPHNATRQRLSSPQNGMGAWMHMALHNLTVVQTNRVLQASVVFFVLRVSHLLF